MQRQAGQYGNYNCASLTKLPKRRAGHARHQHRNGDAVEVLGSHLSAFVSTGFLHIILLCGDENSGSWWTGELRDKFPSRG